MVLGGFWSIFGWILERFGTESGRELKNLKRAAIESLNGTPALIRSASQFFCFPVSFTGFGGATQKWTSQSDSLQFFALDTPILRSVRLKIIKNRRIGLLDYKNTRAERGMA